MANWSTWTWYWNPIACIRKLVPLSFYFYPMRSLSDIIRWWFMSPLNWASPGQLVTVPQPHLHVSTRGRCHSPSVGPPVGQIWTIGCHFRVNRKIFRSIVLFINAERVVFFLGDLEVFPLVLHFTSHFLFSFLLAFSSSSLQQLFRGLYLKDVNYL